MFYIVSKGGGYRSDTISPHRTKWTAAILENEQSAAELSRQIKNVCDQADAEIGELNRRIYAIEKATSAKIRRLSKKAEAAQTKE